MTTNKMILAAVLVAASCCVLFAGGLEDRSFGASELTLAGMEARIELPAPRAAIAEGQPSETELDAFFRYFSDKLQLPRAVPALSGGKAAMAVAEEDRGNILYSIKLEPIRNTFLYTGVGFKTSRGTQVHLSGHKATDCPGGGTACEMKDKIFLALTTQQGQSWFIRGLDVANWGIFMSGSRTIEIDGERFTVKLHAILSDFASSRIDVTSGGRKVLSITLAQMGEALAKKGVDVRLSRDYKLAYGNELVQSGGPRLTEKTMILLIPFPVLGPSSYYLLETSDIRPSGVVYPDIDAKFGFRIQSGTLDIFSLK